MTWWRRLREVKFLTQGYTALVSVAELEPEPRAFAFMSSVTHHRRQIHQSPIQGRREGLNQELSKEWHLGQLHVLGVTVLLHS